MKKLQFVKIKCQYGEVPSIYVIHCMLPMKNNDIEITYITIVALNIRKNVKNGISNPVAGKVEYRCLCVA